jgi:ATP-dependent DNA ligase
VRFLGKNLHAIHSFDLIRYHRADDSIFLYAFGLIELNGDDMRRDPLEVRRPRSPTASQRKRLDRA